VLLSFKALKNLICAKAVNRISVTKKLRRYILIELIKYGTFATVYKRKCIESVTLEYSSDAKHQIFAYVRPCFEGYIIASLALYVGYAELGSIFL
jgi:hypothetical protein